MKPVATPQKPEEKKEDRGLFLQVPYHIIDHFDMSDNAKIGFIRFCRLFNKKDKTIEFRGYYRGLASALKKSPTHTIAIVDQWVQFNLVQREETIDGVILKVNTSAIWERNKIDRETQQCPNYEQQRLYNGKEESSTVHNINTAIQNINTAVHKINGAIQNMDSNEREKALTRLLDITRLLDLKDEGQNHNEQPSGYANATPPCLHPFQLIDLDPLCEDIAYSHTHTPTTSQASQETGSFAVGSGYTNDETPVNPPEKPNKRTSRQRKPKVIQATLPMPSKPEIELTTEEQRVFDLYCHLWFIAVPPKITADRKSHCEKLAPHIASQEDMNDLEKAARKYLKSINRDVKVIELGNLVNSLNTWKASQSNVIDFQSKKPVDVYSLQYQVERCKQKGSAFNEAYKQMLIKNGGDPDHPEIPLEVLLAELEEVAN